MKLHTEGLSSLDEVRGFLDGAYALGFQTPAHKDAYEWVAQELRRFGYVRLARAEKGVLRAYVIKVTGLSRAQVTRLITQFLGTGRIVDRRGPPARPFLRRYTRADIRTLAEVDTLHGTRSGPATRKICERAFHIFDDPRFERLASISNGQTYILRKSITYQRVHTHLTKTRPTSVQIAQRRKPRPEGRPGFVRVDSVHQGDLQGTKGIYLINVVDEVTQFQYVGACPRISEHFLIPVLEGLLSAFPFVIHGLHADNGSEYINHQVARMLQKMHTGEFTKSRARRSNDNALVESKNGSVIRKQLGHGHIPAVWAPDVHVSTTDVLSPFLNYHRPCHFPVTVTGSDGRQRRTYPYANINAPYERFRSMPDAHTFLRPGATLDDLDAIAQAVSDNDAARALTGARAALFERFIAA